MKTIENPRVTVECKYGCSHCEYTSYSIDAIRTHEWEKHFAAGSDVVSVYTFGVDIDLRFIPDEASFDTFDAAFCANSPDWRGPGWYREFRYRDTCRGCDMGETIGLDFVGTDGQLGPPGGVNHDLVDELDELGQQFNEQLLDGHVHVAWKTATIIAERWKLTTFAARQQTKIGSLIEIVDKVIERGEP